MDHGAPGYLDHSMMSRDTPLYMQINTVADTSADYAPTALEHAGNDEKTQAHDGNPGAVFSPMDESLTHEGTLVTPSVHGVHLPLFPPTAGVAGELALAQAEAAEKEVVALRAVVAECARREAALRVELVQALEGKVLAVEVFRVQIVGHKASFKAAWESMKKAYKAYVTGWADKKADEIVAEREAMDAKLKAMAAVHDTKCEKLERKVANLQSTVSQLEEEAVRRQAKALASTSVAPPPCPICQEDMVEGLVALPCGHVLHGGDCAKGLETSSRTPKCPQCPQPFFRRDLLHLFFSPSVVNPGATRDAPGPSTRTRR